MTRVEDIINLVSSRTQIWIEDENEIHIENNEAAYISKKSRRLFIKRVYPTFIKSLGVQAIVIVPYAPGEEHLQQFTITADDVCKRAVKTFGAEAQMLMCMEEMAELTQALSKCFRNKADVENIIEELVDVEIMITQMRSLFGADAGNGKATNYYNSVFKQKILKLLDLVENREKIAKTPVAAIPETKDNNSEVTE